LPAGEIYTNLERGVIDATEWVGPYHDSVMGLQKVAKFYYYPGWHEPGTVLELIVNRQAFESLLLELQNIVRTAAMAQNVWMLSQFEGRNNSALKKLIEEDGVILKQFPNEVINQLRVASEQVIAEIADSDPLAKKVFESFRGFHEGAVQFSNISERAYYNLVQRQI
jgi:TRAP-type mannitol/chloroaromatic compound transport system substrate-binding protein